jgi:cobalt transporter subunit CbtB
MNKKVLALKQENVSTDISRVAPIIAALMVGTFLLISGGFSHSNTIHNAAHDARHAFAFPCH